MAMDILITEVVERALRRHPHPNVVRDRLRLLAENPHHPSLNAHRVHRIKERDIWECYITRAERALYEIKDGILRLWDLGSHAVVDNVHLRSFAAHTRFSRVDLAPEPGAPLPIETVQTITQPTPTKLVPPKTPVLLQYGTPNRFAFFQNAHLRILGVPANLVQSLKQAPSLELALALPGLPEQTRLWLEELSTSPELDEVMFDSSRLLFRTTLDRLEDYCEGTIKRLMLNLQRPEQQRFVDMERAPIILLKGAAGSGKTTVGIYRAIRLAEQGRRVLVLTFNSILSSVTRSLIEELIGPIPDNLRVKTLHSLMREVLRDRSVVLDIQKEGNLRNFLRDALNEVRRWDSTLILKRDERFFEEEIRRVIKGFGITSIEQYKGVDRYGRKTALGASQREAVWKVYQAYQRRLIQARCRDWADIAPLLLASLQEQPLKDTYDDVIVDEAQDLTPVDLRVIQHLVAFTTPGATATNSLMILADAAQTLYSRGFSWKQAGIQAVGRTFALRKNYRNTRQIAEAAAHLLEQNTLMRASNEYVDPEWTQRQGPLPILLTAQNRSNHFASQISQIELVRNRILDLVSDQYFRLSDFAILCPTNKLCEQCKKDLDQCGLRTVLHKDSDFDLLEERIKILTIHSAKGLEFPVVFLLGLTEGELPSTYRIRHLEEEEKQLEIEQQRTLCYVGMTRAAEALYLLTVRGCKSRFVKELDGKITVWQSC